MAKVKAASDRAASKSAVAPPPPTATSTDRPIAINPTTTPSLDAKPAPIDPSMFPSLSNPFSSAAFPSLAPPSKKISAKSTTGPTATATPTPTPTTTSLGPAWSVAAKTAPWGLKDGTPSQKAGPAEPGPKKQTKKTKGKKGIESLFTKVERQETHAVTGGGKGKKKADVIVFEWGGKRGGAMKPQNRDQHTTGAAVGKQNSRNSGAAAPRNALDSTGPIKRRGKERELPKKKRTSALKRIILREREHKTKLVAAGQAGAPVTDANALATIQREAATLAMFQPVIRSFLVEYGMVKSDSNGGGGGGGGAGGTDSDGGGAGAADGKDDPDVESDDEADKAIDAERMVLMERFPMIVAGHSRTYREYCNQTINEEMNKEMKEFLAKLQGYQQRAWQQNPVKATKLKRRLVVGFREVAKYVRLKKIRCIIIAPDIEKSQSDGGLESILAELIQLCQEQSVPILFTLRRRPLGRALKKTVQVSIVGVINYQGAHEIFATLMEHAAAGCAEYAATVANGGSLQVIGGTVVPVALKKANADKTKKSA
jgi:selenocysteine insertion sequence-binding protein 2